MPKLKGLILGYTPDYPEICRYEQEFKLKERNLYFNVYTELSYKPKEELQRIETLVRVSINEIENIKLESIFMSIVVLYFTVILKIIIEYLKKVSLCLVVLVAIVIISVCVGVFIMRSRYYSKYYTFLLNIIENIKENQKSS